MEPPSGFDHGTPGNEVLPLHKLEGEPYEFYDNFRLQQDNPTQRNCQNQLSHPSLSHIEQECQECLIQGKIHIQKNSKEGLKIIWFT